MIMCMQHIFIIVVVLIFSIQSVFRLHSVITQWAVIVVEVLEVAGTKKIDLEGCFTVHSFPGLVTTKNKLENELYNSLKCQLNETRR